MPRQIARPLRHLPLLVLLAVLVMEGYGLATRHLFDQDIWSEIGWQRLGRFTAVYLALTLPLLALAPRAFPVVLIAIGAALTGIAVGLMPLMAVLFIAVSAGATGALVLGRARRDFESQVLNVLVGLALYLHLMGLIIRVRVNFAWTYAGALALPMILARSELRSKLARWRAALIPEKAAPWQSRGALALLLYTLALHWLIVLKPEISVDGLSMHLVVPAGIATHHVMMIQPDRFVWAVMPMGADFLFTIAYVLGGEAASRLLNLGALVLIVALLYSTAKRWVFSPSAMLMAACFVATPLAGLVTGSLMVENVQGAMIFAALVLIWRLWESGGQRNLYALAIVSGAAVATKLGSTSFIVCAVPFAVAAAVRNPRMLGQQRILHWALASVLFLAIASQPFLVAWIKTGNPLFPFLNDKFRSPLLEPVAIEDPRFIEPLRWKTPYDLTFRTDNFYEGQPGSFGFQYLLLLPFALAAAFTLRAMPVISCTTVGVLGSVLVFRNLPNARYIYPALPLSFVPAAALVGHILSRRSAIAVNATFVGMTALDVIFFGAASYYDKSFYVPFSKSARRDYLIEYSPIRPVIGYFNREHPGAAALVTRGTVAGLSGDVYEATWHHWMNLVKLRTARDIPELRRILEQWKVQYIISNRDDDLGNVPLLKTLLERCTDREYAAGKAYLARVSPRCRSDVDRAAAPGAQGPSENSLGLAAKAAGISGTLTVTNLPVPICPKTGAGTAFLKWEARGVGIVEVRVGSPDGGLLARAGVAGTTVAGNWTTKGLIFYLQDGSEGVPRTLEHTIARAEITSIVDGPCE